MSVNRRKNEDGKYSTSDRTRTLNYLIANCGAAPSDALVARKHVDENSVEFKRALNVLGFANFKQLKAFLDEESGVHDEATAAMKKMLESYRVTLSACFDIFNSIGTDTPASDDPEVVKLSKSRRLSRVNLDVYYSNNLPGETYTKEDKQRRANGIAHACLEITKTMHEYQKLIESNDLAQIVQHAPSTHSFLQQCDEVFVMCTTDLLHRGVVLHESDQIVSVDNKKPSQEQVQAPGVDLPPLELEEGDPRLETANQNVDN